MDFLGQIVSGLIIFAIILGVLMVVIMYGGYILLGLVCIGVFFIPVVIERVMKKD